MFGSFDFACATGASTQQSRSKTFSNDERIVGRFIGTILVLFARACQKKFAMVWGAKSFLGLIKTRVAVHTSSGQLGCWCKGDRQLARPAPRRAGGNCARRRWIGFNCGR